MKGMACSSCTSGNSKERAKGREGMETKPMISHFRGTTRECLAHYVAGLSTENGKGRQEILRPLTEFMGAKNILTTRRWVKGRTLTGLRLIKARYFLEGLGYTVIELEKLPAAIRDFSRLIAHNVFTIENACADLGFPRSDRLLLLLRGDRKPSPERMTKILEIVKAYQPLLTDEKGNNFNERYASASPVEIDGGAFLAPPEAAPVKKDDATGNPEHALILQALAKNLEIILPLAELVLTDIYTPEERRELRRHTDVFRVSNALNRLCGEMARAQKPVHWHKKPSPTDQ